MLNDEELRASPLRVLEALDAGDDVTITANGEPRAVVLRVSDGDAEEPMDAVRTHRMRRRIARMQAAAVARGLDRITDDEISAEIAAARRAPGPRLTGGGYAGDFARRPDRARRAGHQRAGVGAVDPRRTAGSRGLDLVPARRLTPLLDARIVAEYCQVLSRPPFAFGTGDVRELIEGIRERGEFVAARPLPATLPDLDDTAFAEVALAGRAHALVTGDARDFAQSPASCGCDRPASSSERSRAGASRPRTL